MCPLASAHWTGACNRDAHAQAVPQGLAAALSRWPCPRLRTREWPVAKDDTREAERPERRAIQPLGAALQLGHATSTPGLAQ